MPQTRTDLHQSNGPHGHRGLTVVGWAAVGGLHRWLVWLLVCGCVQLLLLQPAHAARLALVLGNDDYRQIERLSNAGNDARLMASTLRAAGFDVAEHVNLDRKDMLRTINGFKARITRQDEVVFFYAGHGVQIGQQSPVLLPIDIVQENHDQIVQDGVLLSSVQTALKEAQFALLVIDACRTNPFPPKPDGSRGLGVSVGLSLQTPAEGSVIIMSAASGQKALDYVPGGTRANGLFTHEFVDAIRTPGQNLLLALQDVRSRVQAKARQAGVAQRPAYQDESGGTFTFFAAKASAPPVAPAPTAPAVAIASELEVEQKLWNAIETSADLQDFQDYLARYPRGRFVPLAQRQVRVLTAAAANAAMPVEPPAKPVAVLVEAQPAVTTAPAQPGPFGKRVALLVGNARYEHLLSLKNPVNDVQLIRDSLLELGFEVTLATNTSRRELLRRVDEFKQKAQGSQVALVYLTGHGTRMHSEEFLFPTDTHPVKDERTVRAEAFNATDLEQSLPVWGSSLPILIMDTGRSELFGATRGLVRPVRPSLVFYSSQPKQDGMDGDGTHSPFAKSLAFFIRNKALSLAEVLDKTSEAVRLETRGKQEPAVHARDVPLSNIYLGKPNGMNDLRPTYIR